MTAGLRGFAAAQQRVADRYRRRGAAQWKRFTSHLDNDVAAVLARLEHASAHQAS
jgi:hypothetical protein